MTANLVPFWRAMMEDPRRMGSVLPSGRGLGKAIVREVMQRRPGHVIELGAGTGAITRALFPHRHRFDSFSVVERSERLAHGLAHCFAGLPVHPICASAFDLLVADGVEAMTVVSSLPFRSLPAADRQAVVAAVLRMSQRCGQFRFIQYSYLGRLPFQAPASNLHWSRGDTVFANLPPARLWVLARDDSRASGVDMPPPQAA